MHGNHPISTNWICIRNLHIIHYQSQKLCVQTTTERDRHVLATSGGCLRLVVKPLPTMEPCAVYGLRPRPPLLHRAGLRGLAR